MLTQRQDDLRAIMTENGTFINFPPIGSQTSLISVYGDTRVNIQRTIRSVMQLACQFYVASFWLLPVNFNVLMPASTVNPTHIPALLKRISNLSGAEVVFKTNCFEMHGLEPEVRSAVSLVFDLEVVKVGAVIAAISFPTDLSCDRLSTTKSGSNWNSRTNIASS